MPDINSQLPEEDVAKRIFSCILIVVTQIERDKTVQQYSTEEQRKQFYREHGVKLDQNNKVVKIKYNSIYLQKHLEKKGITANNAFNFYIDSYRGEDALSKENIKVFAKPSKKNPTRGLKYILGEGSFGKAKKVKTSQTDATEDHLQDVVMKKIKKQGNEGIITNEITALKALNRYKGQVEIGEFVYIFTDFVPGTYLTRSNITQLPLLSVLRIALELVNELMVLHAQGIFHFDIKENNVLFNITGGKLQARLIDFGSVRILLPDDVVDMQQISPEGMTLGRNFAPEAVGTWKHDNLTQKEQEDYEKQAYAKVDIYQLGKLFQRINLSEVIYKNMIKVNPLQRDTLELVRKNILLVLLQEVKKAQSVENSNLKEKVTTLPSLVRPPTARLQIVNGHKNPIALPPRPSSRRTSN